MIDNKNKTNLISNNIQNTFNTSMCNKTNHKRLYESDKNVNDSIIEDDMMAVYNHRLQTEINNKPKKIGLNTCFDNPEDSKSTKQNKNTHNLNKTYFGKIVNSTDMKIKQSNDILNNTNNNIILHNIMESKNVKSKANLIWLSNQNLPNINHYRGNSSDYNNPKIIKTQTPKIQENSFEEFEASHTNPYQYFKDTENVTKFIKRALLHKYNIKNPSKLNNSHYVEKKIKKGKIDFDKIGIDDIITKDLDNSTKLIFEDGNIKNITLALNTFHNELKNEFPKRQPVNCIYYNTFNINNKINVIANTFNNNPKDKTQDKEYIITNNKN